MPGDLFPRHRHADHSGQLCVARSLIDRVYGLTSTKVGPLQFQHSWKMPLELPEEILSRERTSEIFLRLRLAASPTGCRRTHLRRGLVKQLLTASPSDSQNYGTFYVALIRLGRSLRESPNEPECERHRIREQEDLQACGYAVFPETAAYSCVTLLRRPGLGRNP